MALNQNFTAADGSQATYWVAVQQNANLQEMTLQVTYCAYMDQPSFQNGLQPMFQKNYLFKNLTSDQLQGDRSALSDQLVLAYANTVTGTDANNNPIYKDPILAGATLAPIVANLVSPAQPVPAKT